MRWSSDSFLSGSSSLLQRTTPGTSISNSLKEDCCDALNHDSGIDDLYPDLSGLVKKRGADQAWVPQWDVLPPEDADCSSTEVDEEVYFTGSDDFDPHGIDVEDGGVPMRYSYEAEAAIMPTNLSGSLQFPVVSAAKDNPYIHPGVDSDSDAYSDTYWNNLVEDPAFEQVIQKMDALSINRFNRELPFWAQYEATRVALHCRIALSNQEISSAFEEFVDQLLEAYKATDQQRSWHRAMAEFCQRYSRSLPQLRTPSTIWTSLQGGNWPLDKSISISLTGTVEFDISRDVKSGPFTILLNPLDTMRGNRFWRKFGSDRFLTLKLPAVPREGRLPTRAPIQYKRLCAPESFNKAIINFLMQEPGIELLGRIWRCFFIRDPRERERKRKPNSSLGPFQAILFAVSGEGIQEPFGVEDLLNWHIPLVAENLESKVPKLWSRISLGLTKTIESVYFTTDQICPDSNKPRKHGQAYDPDPEWRNFGGGGDPMNDGCSIASPAVFRMIQECQGQEEAPSAVQGRLGPSKGLWVVDPIALKEVEQGLRDPDEMWIRVNETQTKYLAHQTLELDPAWTTLELVSWSRPPKSAEVNIQLMAILDHHGVPFEPLRDLVGAHLDSAFQDLFDAIDDPVLLRHWVRRGSRTRASVEYQGGFPADPAERLILCLDVSL